MKQVASAILTITFLVFMAMACNPFGEFERVKAVGSTAGLPQTLQRAFNPGNDFLPLKSPQPGDWFAEHKETGQHRI